MTLTLGGWIFLTFAWSVILLWNVWCFSRVFSSKQPASPNDPSEDKSQIPVHFPK